ncbi:MAG: PASTA domain-containing protein [Acidobacteria bacterium]|nr:PASTA domain-containing protein [Acidobacteriota bacterium]
MALRTRVWSAGKIVLLGAGLLGTYLLFAAASMRLAIRAREVQVPDLSDRTATEATTIAVDLGLTLKVDDTRRVDAKIGEGRVLAQDPPAGATTRRQRIVKVWLSAGQRVNIIPALSGETERSAQLRLSQDGLTLASVSEIRSSDAPMGVVLAQEPPAKTTGTQVSLLVNRGEQGATYVMPDLIGVNGDRAAEILRGRGFRVAVVGSNPYPGVAAGIVIRQSPQGGFQIAPGEPISLEVSR